MTQQRTSTAVFLLLLALLFLLDCTQQVKPSTPFLSSGDAVTGKTWKAKIIRPPFAVPQLATNLGSVRKLVEDCAKWAVVTTIFPPSRAIKKLAGMKDWCLVVVGDKKGPQESDYKDIPGLVFLSPETQESLGFNVLRHLPWNHFGRKNVGYLFAMAHGAHDIWDFDDDNIVSASNLVESLPRTIDVLCEQPSRLINPYPFFGCPGCWPRGFPLEHIRASDTHGICRTTDSDKVGVVQSLAAGDADVDAIFRLTRPTSDIKWTDERVAAVPSRHYVPLNAQATLFRRSAFTGMLLPITVHGRVSDIWRSYILRKVFEETDMLLAFRSPLVEHDRSEHSYLADFESEIPLYRQAGELVEYLKSISLPSSLPERLSSIYMLLYQVGVLEKEDVVLAHAWVADLQLVGVLSRDTPSLAGSSPRASTHELLECQRSCFATLGRPNITCGDEVLDEVTQSFTYPILRSCSGMGTIFHRLLLIVRRLLGGASDHTPGLPVVHSWKQLWGKCDACSFGNVEFSSFLSAVEGSDLRFVDRGSAASDERRLLLLSMFPGCWNQEALKIRQQLDGVASVDTITLTWKSSCLKPGHVYSPGSTWTEGRNMLLFLALHFEALLSQKYDYWIFLDGDVVLTKLERSSLKHTQPWLEYVNWLFSHRPYVGGIALHFPMVNFLNEFAKQIDSLYPNARSVPVMWQDAALVAFDRRVALQMLPYDASYDHSNWWVSQLLQYERCTPYRGHFAVPAHIVIQNTEHSSYSKEKSVLFDVFKSLVLGVDDCVFRCERQAPCQQLPGNTLPGLCGYGRYFSLSGMGKTDTGKVSEDELRRRFRAVARNNAWQNQFVLRTERLPTRWHALVTTSFTEDDFLMRPMIPDARNSAQLDCHRSVVPLCG